MPESNDPGRNPEEEGIPDLQDGTPEAQQAEDPQQMPVPGERPVAADQFGTTFNEQREGEPLDERLAQEEPDVGESGATGPEDPEAGQLSDEPLPGRPGGDHLVGQEAAATPGAAPEETAVHVEELDEVGAPPPDPEENPADEEL
ncbi:hypothetical protein V1J52_02360 [Streptomyces sp. TRM 70351]|uniref:hypothetical protein n=1 Tax=Streptomyces sp. TRM 70351 TaxID=3116552 RepID=UPI002E7C4F16|nr:hypothetical protein [Streptomyces sp. TRM 70351]MEE1927033.1 hypothetical protein [Streptomyces sp. TRM 70351]